MFVGISGHGQWVVRDFIGDCSSCWHFQYVGTTEVDTFNDGLQNPVHGGLISDRQVLRLLGADSRYDVRDVLRRWHLGARSSQCQQQRTAAFHLASQVLQTTHRNTTLVTMARQWIKLPRVLQHLPTIHSNTPVCH